MLKGVESARIVCFSKTINEGVEIGAHNGTGYRAELLLNILARHQVFAKTENPITKAAGCLVGYAWSSQDIRLSNRCPQSLQIRRS
jgi:hypothetical protein